MDPRQQNQYNFIDNSSSNLPEAKLAVNDKKHRIIMVAIGAAIILVIAIVLLIVFSAAGSKDKVNLIKVAAVQQEIIDIAATGQTDIRDAKLSQQSSSTNAVVTSQNQELQIYMGKIGLKKVAKDIAAVQDFSHKNTLKEAKANGTFDTKFSEILSQRVDKYKINLKTAYSATSNTSLKKQLGDDYSAMNVLFPTPEQK
jgi:hypothetical protein